MVTNGQFHFRTLWLLIGWSLVLIICYLSLAPSPPEFGLHFDYADKLKHIFAYFVLMSWFGQCYFSLKSRLGYAVGFIVMGMILEVIQSILKTRVFEYSDMLANILGVFLAIFFISRLKKDKLLLILDDKINSHCE